MTDRSLRDLEAFVPNALVHPPSRPFVAEDTQLGEFTFLPWHRSGVAAAVGDPGSGELRAAVELSLPVEAEGAAARSVEIDLEVCGPGDVLGLGPRQIIRRYPQPRTADAESTFLAAIEFARPDMPWLFTPAAPRGERLTPWLALIVLEDDPEAGFEPARGELPARVNARLRELPDLDRAWAWAHTQVIGTPGDEDAGTLEDRLGAGYEAVNLSRLLCPRPLEPERRYLACLVPSFDAGRAVGLGLAPGSLEPAWDVSSGGGPGERVMLPVYDHWRFATAPAGDFESLASRLEPVPAPWALGRRLLDCEDLSGRLPPLPDAADRIQVLRGPLVSLASAPEGIEEKAWPQAGREALRGRLNRADERAGDPKAGVEGIPIVDAPIYAGQHAAVSRIEAGREDWLAELNLDPRNRVVAGLGTRCVQKDQEQLMQAAWAQLGAVEEENRRARWAQLGRVASESLRRRHLATLPLGDLLQVTRRVHGRIGLETEQTLGAELEAGAVAGAATSAPLRRLARPHGPLARFASGRRLDPARLLAEDDRLRDFRRPYRELDGIASVSPAAAAAIPPQVVASSLQVAEMGAEQAADALLKRGTQLQRTRSVVDLLAAGKATSGGVDPANAALAKGLDALSAKLVRARSVAAAQPRLQIAPAEVVAALAARRRSGEVVLAAPRFPRPMYEALDAYDREWLLPGLGEIEAVDFVTLLETNSEFAEAFLVGLSHEMGRELLWRGYPTDQRGTCFWQFWNRAPEELTEAIHAFSPAQLGEHVSPLLDGRLVFLIRGELIRRYPEAVVLALREGGRDGQGRPVFLDPDGDPPGIAPIVFHGRLDPDIALVGFDLTAAQVREEKWWFAVAEHPAEPRFGSAGGNPAGSSAAVAGKLLRDPVRAAFEGGALLDRIGGEG